MSDKLLSFFYFISLLTAYVILEVSWMIKRGESFTIHTLNYIFQKLFEIAKEIVKDKTGQKYCGMLVGLLIIISLILSLAFLHNTFIQHDLWKNIINAITLVFFIILILFSAHYINQRYIAYCKKNLIN